MEAEHFSRTYTVPCVLLLLLCNTAVVIRQQTPVCIGYSMDLKKNKKKHNRKQSANYDKSIPNGLASFQSCRAPCRGNLVHLA